MDTLPALPTDLPSIAKAKLPATYEGARVALSQCTQIDECQEWADKAEAMASYARQAQDDELRKMADRIQARAIRRCGELLQAITPSKGGRPAKDETGAAPGTSFTRTDAAREAGLSRRQQITATRVSRIPDPEFEEAVESDDPATVTALAERGTMPSRIDHLKGRNPEDFRAATALLGLLHHIDRTARGINSDGAARGLSPSELNDALACIERAQTWLGEVASTLEDSLNV